MAAVLGAIMSTIDSLLVVASSAITRDVYQQTLHPDRTAESLTGVSRRVTFTLAVVAFVIALMVAITIASSRPGHALPDMSFRFADKLVHAAAFAVLGGLWAWALGVKRAALLVSIAICVAFGIADELHQSTVPGRFPDVFDGIADTVGAVLGVASMRVWSSRRARETDGDHSQLPREDPQNR